MFMIRLLRNACNMLVGEMVLFWFVRFAIGIVRMIMRRTFMIIPGIHQPVSCSMAVIMV